MKHALLLLAVFALVPAVASANAGVPMIFLGLPFALIALIPICAIEVFYFQKTWKFPAKKLAMPVVVANLVSTLIGYPLSWLMLLGLQLAVGGGSAWGLNTVWNKIAAFTLQAAWLIPYEGDLGWLIPAAGLVGLIPAYFLTVWFEYGVYRRFPFLAQQPNLKAKTWRANTLSYSLLALYLAVTAIIAGVARLQTL
ncbi:hypothetical protein K2X33_03445 [bacterium]|nr:hypothetical protein [bacterium]